MAPRAATPPFSPSRCSVADLVPEEAVSVGATSPASPQSKGVNLSSGSGGTVVSQRPLPWDRFLGDAQRHDLIALSMAATIPADDGRAAFHATLALLESCLPVQTGRGGDAVLYSVNRYCTESQRHEEMALKLLHQHLQLQQAHLSPEGQLVPRAPPSSLSLEPSQPTVAPIPVPMPRKRGPDHDPYFEADPSDDPDPQYSLDYAREKM